MTTIDELAARVEALEARGAEPLAAVPPITVGSLTNVPVPGSAIQSQWAQDASALVVHRFANVAALKAWAAPNGAVATIPNRPIFRRNAGAWGNDGGMTALTKTSDAFGFVTITAAELGMSTISAAMLAPRMTSTPNYYVMTHSVAVDALSIAGLLWELTNGNGQAHIAVNRTFALDVLFAGTL